MFDANDPLDAVVPVGQFRLGALSARALPGARKQALGVFALVAKELGHVPRCRFGAAIAPIEEAHFLVAVSICPVAHAVPDRVAFRRHAARKVLAN